MLIGSVHGALVEVVWPALHVGLMTLEQAAWVHHLPAVHSGVLVVLQDHWLVAVTAVLGVVTPYLDLWSE